jgi:hypothetical protein
MLGGALLERADRALNRSTQPLPSGDRMKAVLDSMPKKLILF